MAFDLKRVRDELPSARSNVYLNAGTFGPMPRVAADAMRAHVDETFERGRIGYAGLSGWFALLDRARAAFAQTLSASPDEIALMHCTTDGCNTALWALPLQSGDEIVTTSHEHPGLTAPLEELARTKGVVVRVTEPTLDAIVAATTARTRVVAVSHVLWTNGDVLPIAEIANRAREKSPDAFVLVDGAQSVGAIDVKPGALGVDAYTVSGQKWLCGPSGTGALWVRPSALARLGTPWPWYLSKKRGPAGVSEWATARRLDTSTIGMTSLAGIIAALEWHRDACSFTHAATLADRLRARLRETPGVRLIDATTPSQLVSFVVDGEADPLVHRLEAEKILVRSIPDLGCVRASVGFWNDEADIERLVTALAR
jgi:L-cysteine/cystine lyase